MRVSEILPAKRSKLVAVPPTTTIGAAAGLMREHRVGSVLIIDSDHRLLGLLSERDIVHAFAADSASLRDRPVLDLAHRDPPHASLDDTVQSVMELMTATRSRHVPVIRFGRVIGILSIGDVVKSRLEEKAQENAVLQEIARAQYFAG